MSRFACLLLSLVICPVVRPAAIISPANPSLPTPVTVVLDYENPYSDASFAAMGRSLDKLMGSVGLTIELKDKSKLPPDAVFGPLLVFKMKGTCSLGSLPVGALSDERGPLAMAFMSDNQMLSFGQVECDRVRESLQRVLTANGTWSAYQPVYGSALALVLAHEIYHMLSKETHHTKGGVTKESLSAQELLRQNLSIPEIARQAIQRELTSPHGSASPQ